MPVVLKPTPSYRSRRSLLSSDKRRLLDEVEADIQSDPAVRPPRIEIDDGVIAHRASFVVVFYLPTATNGWLLTFSFLDEAR